VITAIFMMIKHVFATIIKLIQSIFHSCGANVFNYLQLAIVILNIRNLVAHLKMIALVRSLDDPR